VVRRVARRMDVEAGSSKVPMTKRPGLVGQLPSGF
jgi:hypothetical protein